jgi:hypothetical protein
MGVIKPSKLTWLEARWALKIIEINRRRNFDEVRMASVCVCGELADIFGRLRFLQ